MIDIRELRDNPDRFREGARKKHFDVDIDTILKLDEERRSLQASVDSRRRELGDKSNAMKSASPEKRKALQRELREFSQTIKEDEGLMREIDDRRNDLRAHRLALRIVVAAGDSFLQPRCQTIRLREFGREHHVHQLVRQRRSHPLFWSRRQINQVIFSRRIFLGPR